MRRRQAVSDTYARGQPHQEPVGRPQNSPQDATTGQGLVEKKQPHKDDRPQGDQAIHHVARLVGPAGADRAQGAAQDAKAIQRVEGSRLNTASATLALAAVRKAV